MRRKQPLALIGPLQTTARYFTERTGNDNVLRMLPCVQEVNIYFQSIDACLYLGKEQQRIGPSASVPIGSDILLGYIFFYLLAELTFNEILHCIHQLLRISQATVAFLGFSIRFLLHYSSLTEV
jgi:hypothetical protein